MIKSEITLKALTSLIFAFALCATTQAQTRTFVSGLGSDANPCTRISPCRSFQRAYDVVVYGGEVIALDSAGYGPLTINKQVSIIGDGGYAGINTSSGDGISISTTGNVTLRSLTIAGLGTASTGINVSKVGTLHVEACVISGFTNNGINVSLNTVDDQIFIKDTITRNNGLQGIQIRTNNLNGPIRASIDNCRSERNGNAGFFASKNTRVTINRSVASGNGTYGFYAFTSTTGTTAELSCQNCVANNNNFGFVVDAVNAAAATMYVTHSTATNNTVAGFLQSGGGVFESLGNNFVRGSGNSDTNGSITIITAQ
jgi:hypothetical protein